LSPAVNLPTLVSSGWPTPPYVFPYSSTTQVAGTGFWCQLDAPSPVPTTSSLPLLSLRAFFGCSKPQWTTLFFFPSGHSCRAIFLFVFIPYVVSFLVDDPKAHSYQTLTGPDLRVSPPLLLIKRTPKLSVLGTELLFSQAPLMRSSRRPSPLCLHFF